MAVGDIYQMKLDYLIPRNEPALNVFWYQEESGGSGSSSELSSTFRASVLVAILAVFPNNCTLTSLQVLNTNDFADNDIYTAFPAPDGLAAGMLDKTQTLAVRKREGGVGTRYSYKRFPAPGHIAIGGWTNGGGTFFGAVNTLLAALGSTLVGAGGTYQPVQVKGGWTMECTVANPSYCGEGQVITNGDLDGNWQVDTYPGHQTSRDDHLWVNSL